MPKENIDEKPVHLSATCFLSCQYSASDGIQQTKVMLFVKPNDRRNNNHIRV